MGNGSLSLDLQCLAIRLVHALAGKEEDCLLATCDDGWHSGDQTQAKEVVGGAGEVEVGWDVGCDVGWEVALDGVEDVKAIGEGEEGDWEVDCSWVCWTMLRVSRRSASYRC